MTDNIETTAAETESQAVNADAQATAVNAEATKAEDAAPTSWIDSIQDAELKDSKSLANFKDLDSLAKSYVNLEKKLGAPKEPEKYEADDYTYELPKDYQANNELLDGIKEKAVELGIKPEAFKTLVEEFTKGEQGHLEKMQSDQRAEWQSYLDEETKYLKEKHNLSPNDIIEKSRNAWGSFVDERYKDVFQDLDQGTQLVVADMLNNISSKISEGSIGKQETYQLTRQEAQNKIDAIYGDPSHAYFTGDTETRRRIGEELAGLQKLAM